MILIGDVKIPRRSTIGSAGYDFYAPDTYELRPGEWTYIDTRVCVGRKRVIVKPYHLTRKLFSRIVKWVRQDTYIPEQWFMMVAPKSGLSSKYGFRIKNTVGIIDRDYMDTIKVLVTVDEPYTLEKGEKFLQGIVIPYGIFDGEVPPTEERTGGHGSTGRF